MRQESIVHPRIQSDQLDVTTRQLDYGNESVVLLTEETMQRVTTFLRDRELNVQQTERGLHLPGTQGASPLPHIPTDAPGDMPNVLLSPMIATGGLPLTPTVRHTGMNGHYQATASTSVLLALINARSVCNKALVINELICDRSIDILCICETWLHNDTRDGPIMAELVPETYKIEHVAREGRGGGVAVLFRQEIAHKRCLHKNFRTFEYIELVLQTMPQLRLITIYRAPQQAPFSFFLSEIEELIDSAIMCGGEIIITGDFNIHYEATQSSETANFIDCLAPFGLTQHVHKCTHTAGHILDLLLTRTDCSLKPSLSVLDVHLSDHSLILCDLSLNRPQRPRRSVTYRQLNHIDHPTLMTDIRASSLCNPSDNTEDGSATALAERFNSVMVALLDEHAPLRTTVIPDRDHAEWYNNEIRFAKQERRRLERRWRQTGLEPHKEAYIKQKNEVEHLSRNAKSDFYRDIIEENSGNPRKMFNTTSKLLGKKQSPALPSEKNDQELAQEFVIFFSDKIRKIRENIDSQDCSVLDLEQVECRLENFTTVTMEEVKTIILGMSNKSCSLDPVPTGLLKKCLEPLLPSITQIIAQSLTTGEVPSCFKVARVIPTLKKPSLDKDELNNYRPVSNLPFLSKVMEKAVLSRLSSYLSANNLDEPLQSAYRPGYSTETALLRVQHDVLHSLSKRRPCLIALLDLSAAFDTVDHAILLRLLQSRGISGTALAWFASYLQNRQQFVAIGNHCSVPHSLPSGVPQGSVLGPVLFNMYTAPLGDLLRSHSMNYHFYADDATVYLSFEAHELDDAIEKMQRCVLDVKNYMSALKLKMNEGKTDLIIMSSRNIDRSLGEIPVLHLGGSQIEAKEAVRSLGVLLDRTLSMDSYINATCQSARYNLHNIRRIRDCLPEKACEQLIHSLVFSKLDYGNALLFGLPQNRHHKLQLVLNASARVLRRVPVREHITPTLKSLHWLPIAARITFKIALLTYKSLHGDGPSYLRELLRHYDPARPLRSANAELLHIDAAPCNLERRAFGFAAPSVWNSLPVEVRQSTTTAIFKSRLKTYLFTCAY